MMQKIQWCYRVLVILGLAGLAGCRPVASPPSPQELTVLAGAGQDVISINAFFPETTRIRVGDTITFQIHSDEPHTVTFLSGGPPPPDLVPVPDGGPTDIMLTPEIAFSSRMPDAPVETYGGTGYYNSGILSNGKVVPPNESYSLTFAAPGTYQYTCSLHPGTMKGEIIVEPASAADLPSQADIDAQANAEMQPLLAMAEEARAMSTNPELVRTEPGPSGSTIWHVPAGLMGMDPRIEIYDFFPKALTIETGDTVIWTSTFFHQVIFHPGQPVPEFILPVPQDMGPPLLVINPAVAFPAKPAGEFDGTGFFSSGLIGMGPMPGGTTFAMTFSEPGSFDYVCATHHPLGMEGVVTVVEP